MLQIDFTKFALWAPDEVQETSLWEKVCQRLVSLKKDYPPLEYLLSNEGGEKLLPRHNLIAVTGKAKRGKSYLLGIWEAALLHSGIMGYTANNDNIKVLHVDTEMDPYMVAERKRATHSLCGWATDEDNDRLNTLTLREDSQAERFELIKAATKEIRPDVLVIDGIADLTPINDDKEAPEVICELMRMSSAYNCTILCVLHQNENNEKMRGWLGTELLNKCFEVYEVTKDKNTGIITAKQKDCRSAPVGDISFSIGGDGVPIQQTAIDDKDYREAQRQEKMFSIFTALFEEEKEYGYNQLVKDYSEREGICEKTAKSRIAEGISTGIIYKSANGSYHFRTQKDDSIYDKSDSVNSTWGKG